MTSGLRYIIKSSVSLTFRITHENKAPIISPKAHILYLYYEEYKSRSQGATPLIDSDISASSAGSTEYLGQPLKYETNDY